MKTVIKIITLKTGVKLMHISSAFGYVVRTTDKINSPFNNPINK